MSRHNHNRRKKRRAGRNLFYLVRSTEKVSNPSLILCNRKPHKDKVWDKYAKYYQEGLDWRSAHGKCYLKTDRDDLSGITHNTDPVPVRLVLTKENPDMYIQKVGENLYINDFLETVEKCHSIFLFWYRTKKIQQVPHRFRISPKLFPEIKERNGYKGVKIVPII